MIDPTPESVQEKAVSQLAHQHPNLDLPTQSTSGRALPTQKSDDAEGGVLRYLGLSQISRNIQRSASFVLDIEAAELEPSSPSVAIERPSEMVLELRELVIANAQPDF